MEEAQGGEMRGKKKNTKKRFPHLQIWEIVAGTSLLALALVLYVWQAGNVPYGWHLDEAGMAYDAYCIANWGVDRFCIKAPVYFINYGGGQNALYTYCAAALIALTGRRSLAAMRLVSAMFGLLAMGAIAALVGKRFGKKAGFCAAALWLVMPYFIMRSRFALESLLMLPTLAVGICLFIWAVDGGRLWQFALCGTAFGISLYSYALDYIALPVFLLLSVGALLWARRVRFAQIVALGVPLALFAAPLIAFLLINRFGLPQIETPLFTIPKMQGYRGGELRPLEIDGIRALLKAIFWCDDYEYNSLPAWGVMYRVSFPLTILGVPLVLSRAIRAVRRREFNVDIAMAALFLAMLFTGMTLGGSATPNCNHINAIYAATFYMLFSVLHLVCQKAPAMLKKVFPLAGAKALMAICPAVITLVYGIFFARFAWFYFGKYPAIIKQYPTTMMQQIPNTVFAENPYLLEDYNDVYVDVRYTMYLVATGVSPFEYQLSPKNAGEGQSDNPAFGSLRFVGNVENVDGEAAYVIWNNDSYNWVPLAESGLLDYEDFGDFILFVPYGKLK